jgi:DNA-binding response OmpR family regulator
MKPQNPIIVLMEDCPVTGMLVERAVMIEMPDVRLLWACSLAEARARVVGLKVDLFLVDVCLPDGDGLSFLWEMATVHPQARAIVMTATPAPEHEMHTAALGVLHFVHKPVKVPLLIQQIRNALNKAPQSGVSNDFRATLENLKPADILQLKCLTQATSIVEFVSDGKVGRVRFHAGEIADAAVGALRGEEAVYEIVSWTCGQVTEHPSTGFFGRTIDCPWQSLLMNAAQRLDESCSVPVA